MFGGVFSEQVMTTLGRIEGVVVKEGVSIAIALLFLVNDPPPRLASSSHLLSVFNVVFYQTPLPIFRRRSSLLQLPCLYLPIPIK